MRILSNLPHPSHGLFVLVCACALIAQSAQSAQAAQVPAARVISVRGTATVADRAGVTEQPLTRGAKLRASDRITTGPDSAVRILLADRSNISIGASTVVSVSAVSVTRGRRKVSLRMTVGRIWARVSRLFGGGSDFEVDTITATAGVRGTELIVEVNPAGKTVVTVVTGAAELTSLTGELRQSIGPMMTAAYDGTGTIQLKPAQAARVKAIFTEVASRPRLTPADREALRKLGLSPGQVKPKRVEPARLDIIDTPAPPLDAEPGAFGEVRVRGKAEFRE